MKEEATIQAQFGVPGLRFEVGKQSVLRGEALHMIHEKTAVHVMPRALALLEAFGLDVSWPLYTRARESVHRVNHRSMFETCAANLLPGYMEIPVAPSAFIHGDRSGIRPLWFPVTVSREWFTGEVYSLDVPPYGHYISGGAVVHNSTKGAEMDVVVNFTALSRAQEMARCSGGEDADDIYRMLYVGATRAKETLYLVGGR
jgi:hypothetical protein